MSDGDGTTASAAHGERPSRAVAASAGPGPAVRPDAEVGARADVRPESPWEQVRTLLLAILIALLVRAVVVEPFRIPSGSMLPTLLIGDHLFVNKFVYGPKVPFTDWRLPGLREPERGDVVVFSVARDASERIHPADMRPDLPREDFVKRIVGLPGDRVELRDGVLLVNGEPVETATTGQQFRDEAGRELSLVSERLGHHPHAILHDPRALPASFDPIVVAPGRYFMMGDNRDFSNDSRSWGTVAQAQLKGPAFVLYWSWSFNGGWLELLNPVTWWSAEKRWDRILQPVR